mmetsp:Transcript_3688/g.12883  ORF Transcript_3688/g.12883 Transcript_3688/m.12883 type:complete len:313 (+) Transcript_3688:2083-3021(+)
MDGVTRGYLRLDKLGQDAKRHVAGDTLHRQEVVAHLQVVLAYGEGPYVLRGEVVRILGLPVHWYVLAWPIEINLQRVHVKHRRKCLHLEVEVLVRILLRNKELVVPNALGRAAVIVEDVVLEEGDTTIGRRLVLHGLTAVGAGSHLRVNVVLRARETALQADIDEPIVVRVAYLELHSLVVHHLLLRSGVCVRRQPPQGSLVVRHHVVQVAGMHCYLERHVLSVRHRDPVVRELARAHCTCDVVISTHFFPDKLADDAELPPLGHALHAHEVVALLYIVRVHRDAIDLVSRKLAEYLCFAVRRDGVFVQVYA